MLLPIPMAVLKGKSNTDVFLGICKIIQKKSSLKITSAKIKLGVKNIVLILILEATETIY